MMPVCLVIPPSVFLLDKRVFVSLGVLRVAAVLERAGHAVEVLDLSGIENYLDAVEDPLVDADVPTATTTGCRCRRAIWWTCAVTGMKSRGGRRSA